MCIERSGGPFVKGLRRVIRDAQIGALLIQSDNLTGEPLLFHTSVPDSIKGDTSADTTVFLMDAQISTGAAAIMAIRVMLDHGVQGEREGLRWYRLGSLIALASIPTTEHNIVFLTYLVAPQGLLAIYNAFPQVRIVAASKGHGIEEWTFALPDTLPGQTLSTQSPAGEMVVDHVEQVNHLGQAFRQLQFNRRLSESQKDKTKKAWIVVPGKLDTLLWPVFLKRTAHFCLGFS